MRWIAALATLLFFVLVAACSLLGDARSQPARDDGPQFDHAGHLQRGVDCVNCHGEEATGQKAMPTLETCMECHTDIDGDKPAEKKAAAFFDAEGRGKWIHASALGSEVIFDHGSHAGYDKDCRSCHALVADSKAIPRGGRLSMEDCMSCHEGRAPAKLECATCHRVIREDVPPPSHRLGWRRQHGQVAKFGELDPVPHDCSYCHKTRSDCDTCHKAEKPLNHNNLWRLHGHASAASIDRSACTMCHTTDSCFECHHETKPQTHRGAFGAPFNRHCNGCHLPADGFADQGCAVCHRGAPSHSSAPPRPTNPVHMTNNIAACVACHTPSPHPFNGQSCLLCHQ